MMSWLALFTTRPLKGVEFLASPAPASLTESRPDREVSPREHKDNTRYPKNGTKTAMAIEAIIRTPTIRSRRRFFRTILPPQVAHFMSSKSRLPSPKLDVKEAIGDQGEP
jgi:hypothetical protein